MHHATRIIERFAMNRQARMTSCPENGKNVCQCIFNTDSNNVSARYHHILNPQFMEAENVFQHRPLLWRKIASDRLVFQRIFDVVTNRGIIKPE